MAVESAAFEPYKFSVSEDHSQHDPRRHPGHRERGPKRFDLTYQHVADATGLSLATVRSGAEDLRSALLQGDLAALVTGIAARVRGHSRKLDDAALAGLLGADVAKWPARFPLFDLWFCGQDGCQKVLVAPGRCEAHGGDPPLVRLDAAFYFEVLVGRRYVPLHRLICGEPNGLDVHHVDFNKWNNRPQNLQPATHEEHWTIHKSPGAEKPTARRGRTRFSFTCDDIGKLCGRKGETVRRLATGRKLDLSDLETFVHFVLELHGQLDAKVARAVLAAKHGDVRAAAAVLGISRATLYRRARRPDVPRP